MTNTEKLTKGGRPAGTNSLFVGWETLTHGENPASLQSEAGGLPFYLQPLRLFNQVLGYFGLPGGPPELLEGL